MKLQGTEDRSNYKDRLVGVLKRRGSSTGPPDESAGDRRDRWAWVSAVVICLLVVGYLPFSAFLFRNVQVNYTFDVRQLNQYDKPSEKDRGVGAVEVIETGDGGTTTLSGLLMQKQYLETVFDTQGVDANNVGIDIDFKGKPEEFWATLTSGSGRRIVLPLYLSRLEDENWDTVESGGLVLYQKGKKFSSLDEFFSYVRDNALAIGLAGATGEDVLLSLGAPPRQMRNVLGMSIRGPHKIELLVTDNNLRVEFTKRDLNWTFGEDDVPFRVLKDGDPVFSGRLPDDGNTSQDRVAAKDTVTGVVSMDGVENGVYELEVGRQVDREDDYVIESLSTNASKAMVSDRIYLYGQGAVTTDPGRKTDLFVECANGSVSAWTWHQPNVEKVVSMDGRELARITPASTEVFATVPAGMSRLELLNGSDMVIQMEKAGFAFREEDMFDPVYMFLEPVGEESQEDFDYFIAKNYSKRILDAASGTYHVSFKLPDEPVRTGGFKLLFDKTGTGDIVISKLRITLD